MTETVGLCVLFPGGQADWEPFLPTEIRLFSEIVFVTSYGYFSVAARELDGRTSTRANPRWIIMHSVEVFGCVDGNWLLVGIDPTNLGRFEYTYTARAPTEEEIAGLWAILLSRTGVPDVIIYQEKT